MSKDYDLTSFMTSEEAKNKSLEIANSKKTLKRDEQTVKALARIDRIKETVWFELEQSINNGDFELCLSLHQYKDDLEDNPILHVLIEKDVMDVLKCKGFNIKYCHKGADKTFMKYRKISW